MHNERLNALIDSIFVLQAQIILHQQILILILLLRPFRRPRCQIIFLLQFWFISLIEVLAGRVFALNVLTYVLLHSLRLGHGQSDFAQNLQITTALRLGSLISNSTDSLVLNMAFGVQILDILVTCGTFLARALTVLSDFGDVLSLSCNFANPNSLMYPVNITFFPLIVRAQYFLLFASDIDNDRGCVTISFLCILSVLLFIDRACFLESAPFLVLPSMLLLSLTALAIVVGIRINFCFK